MRLTLAFLVLALSPAAVCGQEAGLPYEAEIRADDVFVRSGPSHNHYQTGKLGLGDRVTVHRHEPGGWLMISPPTGSFDWILADNVDVTRPRSRNEPVRGVVRGDAVVRIGSAVEQDRRDNWHVRLTRGKRVTILGEKVFDTPQGPQKWYKIAPPADDHRWILGQFVQPLGKGGERVDPFESGNDGDLDPPDVDKERRKKRARRMFAEQQNRAGYDGNDAGDGGGLKERKMVRIETAPQQPADGAGGARTGPTQAELEDDRVRLSRLDEDFRQILRQETSQWSFQRLEQGYLDLQRTASDNAIRRQIDPRLRNVAQYKKVKAEHDEFVRVTRESDER